jgi:hypothetical protein
MTATQLRYRRYLKQTRPTLAIAEFFREYPQFAVIANSLSPAAR